MIKGYGIIGFEQSVVFPFFFFLSISRIDGRLYIHISMYFSLSSKKYVYLNMVGSKLYRNKNV